MLAILISLNTHNLPISQPIVLILESKFMVHRALSDKTYLSLGLLSPLSGCLLYCTLEHIWWPHKRHNLILSPFHDFYSLTVLSIS